MGIDSGRTSRGKLTGIGATVVAVVTVLAMWWLNDGPGTDEPPPTPATSAAATQTSTPGDAPTPTLSPTEAAPTASALGSPSTSPSYAESPSDQMPAVDPRSGLPYVALADLPPEAAEAVALIDAGGPFPYDKDGSRFGNYEEILPDEYDGYYEEYTVETPGSPDRGARRIVLGAEGELYWTEDHYESFERIWR